MRCLRGFLTLVGLAACVLVALQFTPFPWRVYHWLGGGGLAATAVAPDFIVVMGGGGIPSESGLMRTYRAAEESRRFPNAMLAVAMTDSNDFSTIRMIDELEMRGVERARMALEDQGRNTREQALRLRSMLATDGVEPVLLVVTSTEHVRRTVLSLRKAGFQRVGASCAEAVALTGPMEYESGELGVKPAWVPDVGDDLTVRYIFWSNLSVTGRCLREIAALAYYRAMGWI